jgi:hypothetical protein
MFKLKEPNFTYFNDEWNEPTTNDDYGDTYEDGIDERYPYNKSKTSIED